MQRNNTEAFYKDIINKLCEGIKEDFISEGYSEDNILDLKKVRLTLTQSWEEKLRQCGIFQQNKSYPGFVSLFANFSI
jgi:hypothetical protein